MKHRHFSKVIQLDSRDPDFELNLVGCGFLKSILFCIKPQRPEGERRKKEPFLNKMLTETYYSLHPLLFWTRIGSLFIKTCVDIFIMSDLVLGNICLILLIWRPSWTILLIWRPVCYPIGAISRKYMLHTLYFCILFNAIIYNHRNLEPEKLRKTKN